MEFLKDCHLKRFAKFSIVGSLNFFIDIVVLNLLSFITGVNKGFFAAVLSAVSFLVANINSYCLNKKWTFKGSSENVRYKNFLIISIIGVAVNVIIIYIMTTLISQSHFSDIVWLNISKIIATGFVLFFNYFGYKSFVFKG